MTFWVETTSGREFDMWAFAEAIAPKLGAVEIRRDEDGGRNYGWAQVILPDGLSLGFSKVWNKPGRVTVRASIEGREAARIMFSEGLHRRAEYVFPEVSVDGERDLDKLAADIKRRVVEPSAEPLANVKAYFARKTDHRAQMAQTVERTRAEFPAAKIDLVDDGDRASFYLNVGPSYVAGRLYVDGGLYPDRIGTIPGDRLAAVLRALSGEGLGHGTTRPRHGRPARNGSRTLQRSHMGRPLGQRRRGVLRR